MENIPEIILTLIEQKSFDELPESNKKEVLQYMSREEYDSMHQTAVLLKDTQTAFPKTNPVAKEKLMVHFMSKTQTHAAVWSTPIQLWKAASIIILLGAGWFLHWQTYQQKRVEYVTQLDTVYLEKEVPFKVYDTVYYKEEASVTYTSNQKSNNSSSSTKVSKQYSNDMNAPAEPKRRGVSAKDDSLIQSFKFVTL
jgi:hypothetical protein